MSNTDSNPARQHPCTVHCKREGYDIYIGRPSKWGNPFVIGRDGDRAEVIRKYETWLRTQPELMAQLDELSGKVLGCWCAPRACHGDVLVNLANRRPTIQTPATHAPKASWTWTTHTATAPAAAAAT